MSDLPPATERRFDVVNAILAGIVFVIAFITYALTVQQTISYWDCGEFAACARILGIPHPPGTPLFIIMGRIFSLLPIVEDIAHRINYISVISSAFTAMFSYLLTVKIARYFFNGKQSNPLARFIAYVGGITGGLFVAWSNTNWSNSVEAEVYGLALALSVAIVWLTIRFFEERGTPKATAMLVLAFYLALLGVGAHMTVFLVIPVCAIFFILNREATPRDWALICGFAIVELLLIMLFANYKGGNHGVYALVSALLALILLALLFRKINWGIVIAVAAVSSIMVSFGLYLFVMPVAVILLLVIAHFAKRNNFRFEWKTALAIIAVSFVGFSVHFFIPVRSTLDPRIDENNPDRDFRTFVNFLDRKQYGSESMAERMFRRRGELSNQLGRHAHMGFWSYFEEQYSHAGWKFIPFFALGVFGIGMTIRKRVEIGMPFLTLVALSSIGLALYMNFADGTQYDFDTGDAYLEVRDRDYFFTPAFVFFGIAMGMGVAAVLAWAASLSKAYSGGIGRPVVYAVGAAALLLPTVSLAKNYYLNDRSENRLAYNYAYNILQSCLPNTIIFTSGDNDTFPVWALQEVYDFRKDVRVVNLSLLNTDWYVKQMKETFKVPISLSDEQILWNVYETPGGEITRPAKQFSDRARQRETFMVPTIFNDRIVKVADMMVDEVVLQNRWREPIFFSSLPYGESPYRLRERVDLHGIVYKLGATPVTNPVDIDTSYALYMNTYKFDGFADADVYRDENATGVQLSMGVSGTRLYEELLKAGDTARAEQLFDTLTTVYPEYWQLPFFAVEVMQQRGDSDQIMPMLQKVHDTLESFYERNPGNLFYMQDLGLVKNEIGRRLNDSTLLQDGIDLMWKAFELNPNSTYAFRKLYTALRQMANSPDQSVASRAVTEITRAARIFAKYKVNLSDPILQSILGVSPPAGTFSPEDLQ